MINVDYVKDNDLVGVTACSCGILDKLEKYEKGLIQFKDNKLDIIETNNVRTTGIVSSDALTRWNELKELYLNKDVKLIQVAAGGDYLIEMLDYVDFDIIKNNPKWLAGSSDPTSLLFIITTYLGIPTIYTSCNVSGFSTKDKYLDNYFNIIKGNQVIQKMPLKYESHEIKGQEIYNLDTDNNWININSEEIEEEGIAIGGCIESLKDIIGTKFDHVKDFINEQSDGIIWYFDLFSMGSDDLSRTLRQFNNAGWFDNTKAILISKTKYPPEFMLTTYEEAIKRTGINIPIIYQFDIGHVKPSFTIINGKKVKVSSKNTKKELEIII